MGFHIRHADGDVGAPSGGHFFRQRPQPWPQAPDGCRRTIRRMKTATVTITMPMEM